MDKLCSCCCCCIILLCVLPIFPVVFFAVFVTRESVHHILEDAVLSNLSIIQTSSLQQGTIDSASLAFKVWSRNANKKAAVRFWHLRIAVFYNGYELGRAYATPFIQPPRNISRFEAFLHLSNLTVPLDIATRLRGDVESGEVPLKIGVKMRAVYKRVDRSWRTKLVTGELHGDDKCGLHILLNATAGSSSLRGRQCGWTVSYFDPN